MTPEQQRIAIAEACGWRFDKSKHGHWFVREPNGNTHEPGFGQWEPFSAITGDKNPEMSPLYRAESLVPDYLSDLNEMHEAEKVLEADAVRRAFYVGELQRLTGRSGVFSTAAQRAEAFLRTLGKWKDS